jgi:hypothetical protein
MSQSDNDGYNGLKAFAFTVGITVLIFLVLYATKRYNPRLFAQESIARSYSWYLRTAEDPPDPNPDRRRRSLGEKPRIWDVWIASWYPLSRPAGPGRRRGEGEDASRAVDGEKKAEWAGFLVSCLHHTLDPPARSSSLSGYPAAICGQDFGRRRGLAPSEGQRPCSIATICPSPDRHHHPHAHSSSPSKPQHL